MMSRDALCRCICQNISIRFSFKGTKLPLEAHLCHCNICRHSQGTLATFYAELPSPPDDNDLQNLSKYSSSSSADRYYCAKCGAHVFDFSKDINMWTVSTALFQDPLALFRYRFQMFTRDTIDGGVSGWIHSFQGENMDMWSEWPGQDAQVISASPEHMSGQPNTRSDELLHCYCHCQGVEFFVRSVSAPTLKLSTNEPDVKRCISANAKKWRASNCVCNSCRTSTGAEVTQWASIPREAICLANNEPFKKLFGTLKEYRSSNKASRCFCSKCGACAFYFRDDQQFTVDVTVGLMDAMSGARAEEWLHWDTNLDFEKDGNGRGFVEGLKEELSKRADKS